MSKINITRKEISLGFEYEGEQYAINGNATTAETGDVTNITMSIYNKAEEETSEKQYVGSANVYVNGGEKPKINLSAVDTDIIGEVAADIKGCLTALKSEITKTVDEMGTEQHF